MNLIKIKPNLFRIFLLVLLIGLLHIFGTYFYVYWQIPWYDRLVHALGGFLVVYTCLSFFNVKSGKIFIGILASLLVGLGWEYFELQNAVTVMSDKGYWYDTIRDVLSDVFGGVLAVVYFLKQNYE